MLPFEAAAEEVGVVPVEEQIHFVSGIKLADSLKTYLWVVSKICPVFKLDMHFMIYEVHLRMHSLRPMANLQKTLRQSL